MSRLALRFASLGYLAVLLLAPVGFVFYRAFEHGFWPAWHAVTAPDALHALKLTLVVALIAVVANTIFGILCALAIVRYRPPGFGIVNALVDLPLALSPVVVGLSLLLLYGRGGWLAGHNILFATPGIVLATIFGLLWSNFHWLSDVVGSLCWCGAALAVLSRYAPIRTS